MNKSVIATFIVLVLVMAAVAFAVGNWAETTYPDGFSPHAPVDAATIEGNSENSTAIASTETQQPRDAFGYGAATGLLMVAMLYCLLVLGLVIHAKINNRPRGPVVTVIAVVAAGGFILSYLVDGFFF